MITREQFGPYLLLKKLSEDPLGETFRAGLMGRSAMERVVLLRVFNGSALEGQDLWPLIQQGREVQEALRSPNIGNGVGIGQVQGVPFTAYDYISGKNLAQVFEQVVRGNHPVPVEHALLTAERLALGLAVAYETRVGGERILHGFLVPHLVLLSNEGEIRLLGFEAAPGLRQLAAAGSLREAFGRYQAPESLAGHPRAKADDVYSLGAVLLQLLIGRQLPAPSRDTYQNLILEVRQRGLEEVADLLARSLAPAGDRIPDVVTWHKALSKILIDGQYKATTFNLAFFMHNLFRDEIEKETQEIEVERTIKIPLSKPPEVASESASDVPDLVEELARGELEYSGLETRPLAATGSRPSARKKRSRWLIPLAAVVLVGLGVGGYFAWDRFLSQEGSPTSPDMTLADATPPAATDPSLATPQGQPGDLPVAEGEGEPAPEPEVPAGPSPEEILERIDAAVADRTRSMEQSLRSQYDKEIAALRSQLEAAKQAQLESQRRAERAPSRPPQATPAGPIPPATTGGSPGPATSPAAERSRPLDTTTQPPVRAAVSPSPSSSSTTPTTGGATEARPDPLQSSTSGTRTPTPTPATQRPMDAPATTQSTGQPPSRLSATELAQRSPPKARVRYGDLVTLGAGVEPPKMEGRLEPRYPLMAQRLKKEATVIISVLVDENGHVQEAKLAEDKVGFGFDEAALQAARRARFEPARKDGVLVKTWTNLKIEFRLQ